jgi:hypothetical protein
MHIKTTMHFFLPTSHFHFLSSFTHSLTYSRHHACACDMAAMAAVCVCGSVPCAARDRGGRGGGGASCSALPSSPVWPQASM